MEKYIDLTLPIYFVVNTETDKTVDSFDSWIAAERESHYLTATTRVLHTVKASESEVVR